MQVYMWEVVRVCIPFGFTQAIKQVNMQIATIIYKIQMLTKGLINAYHTYHLTTRACALCQNSLAKSLLHVAGKDYDIIC